MRIQSRSVLACSSAVLISLAAFWPVLFNGFVNYDDPTYVFANPRIQSLSWDGMRQIFSVGADTIYIPLTYLGYALQNHFFGINPFYYHLISLLVHLGVVVTVYGFARKLTGCGRTAFWTSLFFGVHPLHVEPVAWAASQKDVLSGLLFFASLWSYRSFIESRQKAVYALSIACFSAAMLSKPLVVMLPFILFMVDRVRPQVLKKIRTAEKIPYFAIGAGLVAITLLRRRAFLEASGMDSVLSIADRMVGTGHELWFYFTKTVFPIGLSCVYPAYRVENYSQAYLLFCMVIAIGVPVATFFLCKKRTPEAFGAVFFVGMLLPILPSTPFGTSYAADRYGYIPLFGLFLSAASFVVGRKADGPLKRRAVWTAAVFFVSVLCILTWQRGRVWSDSLTLWNDALTKYPTLTIALKGRAEAYYSRGQSDEAIADLKIILKHHPELASGIYSMLGDLGMQKEDYVQALAWFEEALKRNPGDGYSNRGAEEAARLIHKESPSADGSTGQIPVR